MRQPVKSCVSHWWLIDGEGGESAAEQVFWADLIHGMDLAFQTWQTSHLIAPLARPHPTAKLLPPVTAQLPGWDQMSLAVKLIQRFWCNSDISIAMSYNPRTQHISSNGWPPFVPAHRLAPRGGHPGTLRQRDSNAILRGLLVTWVSFGNKLERAEKYT